MLLRSLGIGNFERTRRVSYHIDPETLLAPPPSIVYSCCCCLLLISSCVGLFFTAYCVHPVIASAATVAVRSPLPWPSLTWPTEEDTYYQQHRYFYSPAYFPTSYKSAHRSPPSSSESAGGENLSPSDYSASSSLTVPNSPFAALSLTSSSSSSSRNQRPTDSLAYSHLSYVNDEMSTSNIVNGGRHYSDDSNKNHNHSVERILNILDEVTGGHPCNGGKIPPGSQVLPSNLVKNTKSHDRYIRSPLPEMPPKLIQYRYALTAARVELLSAILSQYNPSEDDFRRHWESFRKIAFMDEDIVEARAMWVDEGYKGLGNSYENLQESSVEMAYYYDARRHNSSFKQENRKQVFSDQPWLQFSPDQVDIFMNLWSKRYISQISGDDNGGQERPKCPKFANWTIAYYSCVHQMWLFSYTSLIISHDNSQCVFKGIISVDMDISQIDINQCDSVDAFYLIESDENSRYAPVRKYGSDGLDVRVGNEGSLIERGLNDAERGDNHQFYSAHPTWNSNHHNKHDNNNHDVTIPLHGTHKCHQASSKCKTRRGHGWTRGGYFCVCRDGFYAPSASFTGDQKRRSFNGTEVEKAWYEKVHKASPQYDMIYVCQRCSEGCVTCNDGSACLSSYNWAFRVSLLTISILCIFLTGVLAGYIYKFRKLKVFKVASPIFLCITLLGCAIMYSEMAAIFPVLTTSACIATKVTRNMGFCITYSALLLKTWRVSLTYRVKSAHKLKLTDKQLLQWLFPILLVMAIYLGTWTISDPPEPHFIKDWQGLKFKICRYNWWDHSLVIGEFLFLLWGIKVCYNVRNAESFFNEAKYITWAIYNIAVVNIIMILVHLLILPNAGPDGKYFFGFIRTQLSTSITIILIFGPKFYRVIKGQGDSWDNRVRARGVNASFSLNGVGLVHEETTDLYQENEELKEEIHKLATQIELMKLMQMEINNRHLKPKHGTSGHHILPTVTITANPTSAASVTQSPIVKAVYSRFDANDAPSPRISPAAELASERV